MTYLILFLSSLSLAHTLLRSCTFIRICWCSVSSVFSRCSINQVCKTWLSYSWCCAGAQWILCSLGVPLVLFFFLITILLFLSEQLKNTDQITFTSHFLPPFYLCELPLSVLSYISLAIPWLENMYYNFRAQVSFQMLVV